jgi:hypothetical protein
MFNNRISTVAGALAVGAASIASVLIDQPAVARTLAVGLVCIASVLIGQPADASSVGAERSPIVVTSARFEASQNTSAFPAGQPYRISRLKPGHLSVTFHNTAPVAATHVTFEVSTDDRHVARVTDVGTFSPGISISHHLDYDSIETRPFLRVAEVRFADGSVWTNPARARRQAAW